MMMKMKKKRKEIKLISVLFFIVFLLTLTILLNSNIENIKPQTITTRANGSCTGYEDDEQGCQWELGGDLRNGCNWDCNNPPAGENPVLIHPPCCAELARTGDSTVCCFNARRRCTPEECASVQGQKNRCGQLWELGLCKTQAPTTIPTTLPTSTSIPTQRPSNTPIPTQTPPTPTSVPTQIPIIYPTSPPIPSIPLIQPTATQIIEPVLQPIIVTPSPEPNIPYQQPGFSVPLVQIPTIPMVCSTVTAQSDPFITLLDKLAFYDRQIENTINIKLLLLFHAVKTRLNTTISH